MGNLDTTDWIAKAAALGPTLAQAAARVDREGTFVIDNHRILAEQGFLAAGIPSELGGGGASHAEVSEMLRVLGRHCGSTALALSMHQHLVAATVWKHRQGQPGEALLRRVANERLVLVSTGAGDWMASNGHATRVEGGYRVTASKHFSSGSPVGNLLMTSIAYDDPEKGPSVLHFGVPMQAEGLRVDNNWDSLGMRGTGSHTVGLENVFVPDAAIALQRPRGQWHPVWNVILTVAVPLYMAPYVGVAEAAAEQARSHALQQPHDGPLPLLLGELENAQTMMRLAWKGAVDNARNYDFAPELGRANTALVHKSLVAEHAISTVEKAMEIVGGRSYLRARGVERLLRDVHGAPNHPLPEKRQQWISGRIALGLSPL